MATLGLDQESAEGISSQWIADQYHPLATPPHQHHASKQAAYRTEKLSIEHLSITSYASVRLITLSCHVDSEARHATKESPTSHTLVARGSVADLAVRNVNGTGWEEERIGVRSTVCSGGWEYSAILYLVMADESGIHGREK